MSIKVNVSDLRKIVEELENEEIEYVEIDIYDEHEFDGEMMPKSLTFIGEDGYGGGVDFDSIDHVNSSVFYKAEREMEEGKSRTIIN